MTQSSKEECTTPQWYTVPCRACSAAGMSLRTPAKQTCMRPMWTCLLAPFYWLAAGASVPWRRTTEYSVGGGTAWSCLHLKQVLCSKPCLGVCCGAPEPGRRSRWQRRR